MAKYFEVVDEENATGHVIAAGKYIPVREAPDDGCEIQISDEPAGGPRADFDKRIPCATLYGAAVADFLAELCYDGALAAGELSLTAKALRLSPVAITVPRGDYYSPPVGTDKQRAVEAINAAMGDPSLKRDRIRVEGEEWPRQHLGVPVPRDPEPAPQPKIEQRARVAAAIARIDDALYTKEPTTDAERNSILAVMRSPLK